MRIFSLLCLLVLLAQTPLLGLHAYTCRPGDKLHVLAPSGIRLRNAPRTGEVLAPIPYGTMLEFLAQDREIQADDQIENIYGNWIQVAFNGKQGWVFDGFLSHLPAPSAACHSIEAYVREAFRPVGGPQAHTKTLDGESVVTDTLRTFAYGNGFVAVMTDNHGYESYAIEVAFYHVSAEEIWLIAQLCYKAEILEARKRLEALRAGIRLPDDCSPHAELATMNQQSLSTFAWDKPDGDMITIDLMECTCYEDITIKNMWNMIIFSHEGGC